MKPSRTDPLQGKSPATRRLRSTAAPTSGNNSQFGFDEDNINSSMNSSNDTEPQAMRSVKNRSAASLRRWYQGMTQKLRDHNKRSSSSRHEHHSLHTHHTHHHASTTSSILRQLHPNDSIRVNIPIRMMLSTLAVFLILPLTMFVWKEMQLHPPNPDAMEKQQQQLRGFHAMGNDGNTANNKKKHENFPTWMDENGLVKKSKSSSSSARSGDASGPMIVDEGNKDEVSNMANDTAAIVVSNDEEGKYNLLDGVDQDVLLAEDDDEEEEDKRQDHSKPSSSENGVGGGGAPKVVHLTDNNSHPSDDSHNKKHPGDILDDENHDWPKSASHSESRHPSGEQAL